MLMRHPRRAAQRLTALEDHMRAVAPHIPGLTSAAPAAGVTAANVEALTTIDHARASTEGCLHAFLALARRALAGHSQAIAA
jgi:hypothetical protein